MCFVKREITTPNERSCNCVNEENCPLNGKCLKKDIIYIANITSDVRNYRMIEYKGISATIFKDRFGNHKKSFNNKSYKLDTELSPEVWAIRDKRTDTRE